MFRRKMNLLSKIQYSRQIILNNLISFLESSSPNNIRIHVCIFFYLDFIMSIFYQVFFPAANVVTAVFVTNVRY